MRPRCDRHSRAAHLIEITAQPDDFRIEQTLSQQRRFVVHKTDDSVARVFAAQNFAGDFNGVIAGTDDQNSFANLWMPRNQWIKSRQPTIRLRASGKQPARLRGPASGAESHKVMASATQPRPRPGPDAAPAPTIMHDQKVIEIVK